MEAVWRFRWCSLIWLCGCLADQVADCWCPCTLSIPQYGALYRHHDRPCRVDRTCDATCGCRPAVRAKRLRDSMRIDSYRLYQLWDVLIAVSVTCAVIEIPLRLVLRYTPSMRLMAFEGLITLILGLDVVVQWHRHPEP